MLNNCSFSWIKKVNDAVFKELRVIVRVPLCCPLHSITFLSASGHPNFLLPWLPTGHWGGRCYQIFCPTTIVVFILLYADEPLLWWTSWRTHFNEEVYLWGLRHFSCLFPSYNWMYFFSHLNIILFHIMIFMSVNPDTEKLYQAWEKMMNAKNNSHIRKDFLDYFSLSVLMTLL